MKKRFLVEDYTKGLGEEGEPEIKIVDEDELYKIVHSAIAGLPKIAVHKIGECIIDWS